MVSGFLQLLGDLAVPRLEEPPPTVVDDPVEESPPSDQTRISLTINREIR